MEDDYRSEESSNSATRVTTGIAEVTHTQTHSVHSIECDLDRPAVEKLHALHDARRFCYTL
jgi:hypothetical protein